MTLPPVNEQMAENLLNASQLIGEGDYNTALSLLDECETEEDAFTFGLSSVDFSYLCFLKGLCYSKLKENYKAIEYFLKSESKFLFLAEYPFAAQLYNELINSYISTEQLDKAQTWGEKYLNRTRRKYGNYSEEVAKSYFKLYIVSLYQGNPANCLQYLDRYFGTLFVIDKEPGDDVLTIRLLLQYATLLYNFNQLDKAYEICKVIEKNESELSVEMKLQCYNILVQISTVKAPNDVSAYIDKTFSIISAMGEDEEFSPSAYEAINNYAIFVSDRYPEKSLDLLMSLADELMSKGKTKSLTYATVQNNIGTYIGLDNPKSTPFLEEAFDIVRKSKNADVTNVLLIGSNLIQSLLYSQNVVQIKSVISDMNSYFSNHVNTAFISLSEENRGIFWHQIQPWYHDLLPEIAVLLDDADVWGMLYDSLLQSRSILLSSSISLNKLIEQSEDDAIKKLYSQWNDFKDNEALKAALESKLLGDIKNYGNFMASFNCNHTDIKEALNTGEIAVEFIKYDPNVYGEETAAIEDVRYLALIQTSYSDNPIKVDLCLGSDIKEWTLSSLYHSIWRPMEEYIAHSNTVYFSPDGDLFSLPIEYAQLDNGKLINEYKNICRLSSTRELTANKNASGKDIALFGGMKFDLSVAEMEADAAKYRDITEDFVRERGRRGALVNLNPLPGTKIEVESIYAMIKSNTLPGENGLKLYKEDTATEAAFKSYSGKNPQILHIASHGFYNSENHAYSNLLNESEFINYEQEELKHSGILFSGADNVRMEETVPPDVEDGVLDAYEISKLDLHGTSLVVLSACETGLGTISADGVFGLQRGFKKAGVNSILMSLWKVDDNATCCLMTNFYKYLLDDATKFDAREALKKAQNDVKSNAKWNDAKYWAGFILLD